MAKIIATAKAVPPYNVEQAEAAEYDRVHFGPAHRDIERLIGVFTT